MAATLAEIQSWPEVPAIAHFCSLFRASFDLIEFEIEELETALLARDSPQDDMFASSLLERLVVRLLRGCLPASAAAAVHEGNFSNYLGRLIRSKQEEAEEEGLPCHYRDPFQGRRVEDFLALSCLEQVRAVSQLTQARLEAGDATERLKDLDPDGMRVEPLGEDSDGVVFWYFFGVRLYKEVKARKPKKPRKKKEGEKGAEAKTKKGKKADEDDDEDEEEPAPREPPGWYVACSSEAEWNDLTYKYKKSKKKQDRELHSVLVNNFMPEISKMFQDKEKEERIKIMMMNKRSSGRLDRKRAEKEAELDSRREEEERRELEQRAEQERERRREKENKQKGRGERAKLRGEPEVAETLQPNRKRGREEVRVRGSPREVVEEDHDYTGRRRNPALREWRRLHSQSSEDGEGGEGRRNLRF